MGFLVLHVDKYKLTYLDTLFLEFKVCSVKAAHVGLRETDKGTNPSRDIGDSISYKYLERDL